MSVNQKYQITIKDEAGRVLWQRMRFTMPEAVASAVVGAILLHSKEYADSTGTKAAEMDMDCAAGWVPRTAPLLIKAGGFTLEAKRP